MKIRSESALLTKRRLLRPTNSEMLVPKKDSPVLRRHHRSNSDPVRNCFRKLLNQHQIWLPWDIKPDLPNVKEWRALGGKENKTPDIEQSQTPTEQPQEGSPSARENIPRLVIPELVLPEDTEQFKWEPTHQQKVEWSKDFTALDPDLQGEIPGISSG